MKFIRAFVWLAWFLLMATLVFLTFNIPDEWGWVLGWDIFAIGVTILSTLFLLWFDKTSRKEY